MAILCANTSLGLFHERRRPRLYAFMFHFLCHARPRLLSASGTIDLPLARTAKVLISGHSSIRALGPNAPSRRLFRLVSRVRVTVPKPQKEMKPWAGPQFFLSSESLKPMSELNTVPVTSVGYDYLAN